MLMDDGIKNLLEQLLVSRVLDRARQIRIAWNIKESDNAEAGAAKEKRPNDNIFVDEAVDEIKGNRNYVLSRLSSP
jgi:hypothetical protein